MTARQVQKEAQNIRAVLEYVKQRRARAFLNSDIGRFFVEIYGRATGGGVIELDDKTAGKIPVLNCSKISDKQSKELSELFDRLESETRLIGGAETQESLAKLQPIIGEIDSKIAETLGLKAALVEKTMEIVKFFSDRRVARIERASPESVKGEEEPKITPPKKSEQKKDVLDKQLTRWIK